MPSSLGDIHFFKTITVKLPWQRIYRRLGYQKGTTQLTDERKEQIDGYIDEVLSLIHLQGAIRRAALKNWRPMQVELADGTIFESRRLAAFLGNCGEVLLMAATAGNRIVEEIREDTKGRDFVRGIILDAAASELTDAALDWIMAHTEQSLRRENKTLPQKRFSAGYGDFDLKNQQAMHRLLQLEKIGVAMTERFMLVPEKSVTAVTRIEEIHIARSKG
jgi:hypothetical protein